MKTVLCHGCFDLLHVGHIRHLEAARKLGDKLIVTVTADKFVNKGDGRPAFTAAQRVECLQALRCVDEVWVNDYPTAVETIHEIRPTIYAKGPECRTNFSPGFIAEREAIEEVGGVLTYTDGAQFHSTDLLRKVVDFYA